MLKAIIISMRPEQWIKNLFVLAPLLFSQNLLDLEMFFRAFLGFLIFCGASGAIYLVNDVKDIEEDRSHPKKAARPVASGRLSVMTAVVSAILLSGLCLGVSWFLSSGFAAILLIYLTLNLLYSFILKELVIIDVMTISAGFVLRVLAGSAVIDVPTSQWVLICTALIALFLGFSKRRHELILQENGAVSSRKVLSQYSPYFLDQMIAVVTASTVMSYALYTVSEETVEKFQTSNLIYTVPFVLYGIFRYLYLVHQKDRGGNPAQIMLSDKPMMLNVILWVVVVLAVLYQ
ncbi:MAG: decaprenyl-phosphate phosphoribosyltransferase [Nitrospirae bacterium CG_4_9_14_3_um_filter_53_35]|nr:MAG: hypothetical protein AUK29_03375 [Nitrospirae bacterium CG2_30_53_67]PIV82230.1 MAG: decaprenyl-phosphate phosphoribosyltransferase [Nitrospirae bacterium CG17_big_fil_post_rev_8_21_14_2_50_50_9]PJA73102.1 MAG: decaprenyl-phosphate phosphoribosyltransferase [Nitrospirae bacterium CG_4_9_14_3_um_filter_53_35]